MQTSPIPAKLPPHKFPYIAVAVKNNGSHIGILYRINNGDARLLHLGWHHWLLDDESIRDGYAWAACEGFSEDEGRDFASWLQKIYKLNNGRIPYGINYWPGAHFDENGVFTPSRNGLGLTCATFVMSLFEAHSYPIINTGSWEKREDDQQWFQDVIERLKDPSQTPAASPEHIDAQINSMGSAVRFRPLEVAAAASIYDIDPIEFKYAIQIAEQFKNDLHTHSNSHDTSPLQLIAIQHVNPENASLVAQAVIAKTGKEGK